VLNCSVRRQRSCSSRLLTIAVSADIKVLRAMEFAQRASIANGPQQVNNAEGAFPDSARAGDSENPTNELMRMNRWSRRHGSCFDYPGVNRTMGTFRFDRTRRAVGVVALAFVVCIPQSRADRRDYQCEVLAVAFFGEDGLVAAPDSLHVGKRFAVNRITGEVVGSALAPWGKPQIKAKGDTQNSFVVIWEQRAAGNGVHLDSLYVREYAAGDEKPFLYVSGGAMVVTGKCR